MKNESSKMSSIGCWDREKKAIENPEDFYNNIKVIIMKTKLNAYISI